MTGWTAIGLMSGTSVDGIDAAILRSDGYRFDRIGHDGVFDYRAETKSRIWAAVNDPIAHMQDQAACSLLDQMIAEDHAAAVTALLGRSGIRPDLIGFHGQTIYHNPEGSRDGSCGYRTIQLGDAALLARLSGIDVVHDVRRADMIAGGEGAPLAPVYHKAIFDQLGYPLPVVLVNIGGVANLTYYAGGNRLIGFDTGPGNALLDDYMRQSTGQSFDQDGALAARGVADRDLVAVWMSDAFFAKPWPKSLDRQAFHGCLDAVALCTKSPADAMASLTLFTAQSIATAIASLPEVPKKVMLAGGGRHNRCLYNMLRHQIGSALAAPEHHDDAGSPDMLEAELMAFLAIRFAAGLPTSFPATTGCNRPVRGGRLASAC